MPRSPLPRVLALAAALAGPGAGADAEAAPKRAKTTGAQKKPPKPASKGKTPVKAKEPAKDKDRDKGPEELAVTPGAKVALFAFVGDDVEPVRRQVLHVLRSKGLKVDATLRPFDSPEQYRETAVALGLVAYVDGEVTLDGGEGSATVYVRSGATGLRVASITFASERRQLPADVAKGLWEELNPPLARACAAAAKPRQAAREPMRINAGIPIADTPRD